MNTNFMKESIVPSVGDVLITDKDGFVLQIVDLKVAKSNMDIDARTDFAMVDLGANKIIQGVTRPEAFAIGTSIAGASITKIVRASELVLTNQATLDNTIEKAVTAYSLGDLADIPTSRLVEILKDRQGVAEIPAVDMGETALVSYSDSTILPKNVDGVARILVIHD